VQLSRSFCIGINLVNIIIFFGLAMVFSITTGWCRDDGDILARKSSRFNSFFLYLAVFYGMENALSTGRVLFGTMMEK